MPARTKSPHDEELGFITARVNRLTKSFSILYDGEEAGFDISKGKWNVFCSEHGTLTAETSKARATKMLKSPENWCKSCARKKKAKERLAEPVRQLKEKTSEDIDKEKRFFAKKAKNNPEKQILFEKIYGVGPELYWD